MVRYDWGAHTTAITTSATSTAKKAPVAGKKRKAGADLSSLGDEELNKMWEHFS